MGSKPVEYRVAYRLLELKPCPYLLRKRRSDKAHTGLGAGMSCNTCIHGEWGELEVSSDGTYDRAGSYQCPLCRSAITPIHKG
jgi:hypothetical protein